MCPAATAGNGFLINASRFGKVITIISHRRKTLTTETQKKIVFLKK